MQSPNTKYYPLHDNSFIYRYSYSQSNFYISVKLFLLVDKRFKLPFKLEFLGLTQVFQFKSCLREVVQINPFSTKECFNFTFCLLLGFGLLKNYLQIADCYHSKKIVPILVDFSLIRKAKEKNILPNKHCSQPNIYICLYIICIYIFWLLFIIRM